MNGYQKIQEILKGKDWETTFTDEMYKNKMTRFNVKCEYGHTWETCLYNLENGQNCKICVKNSGSNIYKLTIAKGDCNEIYICDILNKNKINAYRPVIGNNTFDIIISINGIDRGIQIKELRKSTRCKNGFITCFPTKYPKNTLIVLVNQTYGVYVLLYAQDVKTTSMTFTINDDNSKYSDILYTDYNKFEKDLIKKCKKSYIINDISNHFTDGNKKEYEMLKRLKIKCEELDLDFKYNTTNSNETDCIINGKNIQCKFVSLPDKGKNFFNIKIAKCDGKGGVKIPYHINDKIDYFIFEIGGTNNDKNKYINKFCVISKKELHERGYISSKESKGKTHIFIFPYDYVIPKGRSSTNDFMTDLKYWDLKNIT
jgi:hypothetical protein